MDASGEDDGLKWFGEGFDGFPKRLPEDCVEYAIHLVGPTPQDVSTTRTRLNVINRASRELCQKLLKDYIWQRDGYGLELHSGPSTNDSPSHTRSDAKNATTLPILKGRTNFGDSVSDEWLIVYLLLELSKQFSDAWIRVYDTDGEFLLIEAATALPKWLNPDIAENRVWLNNGHLRIVSPSDGETATVLSLHDALAVISQQPHRLMISPYVEDEAFHRLREYPSAISSSLHHALITIPRRLAFLLRHNPSYVSPAIEAFYLRDSVSLKPLATKNTATLRFAPDDLVSVSTKFTKVGFAQVRSQVFDPPPAWTALIPRGGDQKAEVGMKLACGFEMMLSDPQNQNRRDVREIELLLGDLAEGAAVLPSDGEIASWPQTQDDESWLDIDYNDFDKELSGKGGDAKREGTGFGDARAHETLRKMVSRFQDFLDDDTAGVDGIDESDHREEDTDSESEQDEKSNIDEGEFQRAMSDVKAMDSDAITRSGLLDEARRLALEDEQIEQDDVNEDEEMRNVMKLMERELKTHGALDLKDGERRTGDPGRPSMAKPVFGPALPPHMQGGSGSGPAAVDPDADRDVGPADNDLSSDDEEFNDVDLGLARNMLESFKGQIGLPGPAGNLMRSFGVHMPRDEDNSEN